MKKSYKISLIAAVIVGLIAISLLTAGKETSSGKTGNDGSHFITEKDDLVISFTETGGIMALETYDIKSQVEGRTTIVSIVDEGTVITPEDVNKGKVLVELDSSEIEDKLTQKEINYLSAKANLTEAKESYDIQLKENKSNIQSGEMNVRFAAIDLRKYIGETLADKLMKDNAYENYDSQKIADLVDHNDLGGDALQKLRKLKDDITLADMKYARAYDKYQGTKQLYEKKYVAETELKGDELEVESLKMQRQSARTELSLYKAYEFPKQTEKLINDLKEAILNLDKTKAQARSKLAQAEAKKQSSQAKYDVQKKEFEKLQDQLEACVIKAPAPGQVVYSSSTSRRRRREPIDVGEEVRYRQEIISIPDPTQMKVEIKVHETWVDKVEVGQKAKVTIAAFPENEYEGEVLKKAPLADPPDWHNPDLKVYTTDVIINGNHKELKTGMTAKVEVIIDVLDDVIYVPIQSVVNIEGNKYCYVETAGDVERREVETGQFNTDYVEIKEGLQEGENVMLNPPRNLD